jgi:hypothetical protein
MQQSHGRVPYIWMPMEFSQAFGFQCNKCRSQGLRNWKVSGVNLPELPSSTWDLFCRMLERAVDVGCITSNGRRSDSALADSGIDDVRVRCWKICKHTWIDTEVFCDDVSGGVGQPIVDHECGSRFVSKRKHVDMITTHPALSKSASSKTKRYSFSSSRPWMV